MDQIPSVFWMAIIGVLTIFICYVLYHLAMLLNESRSTVFQLRMTLKDVNGIVSEVTSMIDGIKTPVYQITGVVQRVSSVFNVVSGVMDGFKSGKKST